MKIPIKIPIKIRKQYNGKSTVEDILNLYLENISNEVIEKNKQTGL
jgi:hypothetical protein